MVVLSLSVSVSPAGAHNRRILQRRGRPRTVAFDEHQIIGIEVGDDIPRIAGILFEEHEGVGSITPGHIVEPAADPPISVSLPEPPIIVTVAGEVTAVLTDNQLDDDEADALSVSLPSPATI